MASTFLSGRRLRDIIDAMKKFVANNLEDTLILAENIGKKLKNKKKLIAFYGGLGAGKTAFVRGLSKGLEITSPISSPTFSIVNVYKGQTPLIHFDMYRITGEEDLESTGFFDYLSENAIIAVEWAENIEQFLPKDRVNIKITKENEDKRIFEIEDLNGENFRN
ncbi:MAG: tRNA (adenosine(37)-N6)-threonylcarbamoyltransferase complex ATPase subunit type 1 TsaE [Clostridia bacterium]|nr:tRNA (adenosine(37)-N6)-threonylcarbamoyltransferase complex ATPase subunit type 1 TsaE [Clostridia bacterium]